MLLLIERGRGTELKLKSRGTMPNEKNKRNPLKEQIMKLTSSVY